MTELNRYIKLFTSFVLISFFASCGFIIDKPTSNSSLTLSIEDTPVALNGAEDELTSSNDADPVFSVSSSFRAGAADVASGYYLKLIGTLNSPEADGTTLRASHLVVEGNYAYITYMIEGEQYGGAIDIIDISDPEAPVRVAGEVFTDMDVTSVAVSGSSVFIGGSEDDDIPAVIEKYSFNGSSLSLQDRAKMPSYYVNSLVVSGSYLIASSGDDEEGGLFLLTTGLDAYASATMEGIRYVDTDGTYIYVLQEDIDDNGSGSMIIKSLNSSLTPQNGSGTAVAGMTIAEAKSTLYVSGDLVYIAASDGGYSVYDISDPTSPSLLDSFDQPVYNANSDGIDPQTTTNAVSIHETDDFGTFMFLANGEAGTYIAAVNNSTSYKRELIGRFLFDDNESANYVGGKGNVLFSATGVGGLKIVEIAEFTGDLYETGDFFHDQTDPYHDSNGLPLSSDFIPDGDLAVTLPTNSLGAVISANANTMKTAALTLLQPNKKKNNVSSLYPELFDGSKRQTIELVDGQSTEIYATFLSETAGFKNTFGYYNYDDGNPPSTVEDAKSNNWKIVFANASQSKGGGYLNTGDTVLINSVLTTQENWGFFLMSNGWRGNKVSKGIYEMYTHNALNDTDRSGNELQQTIMMYKEIGGKKHLFLGFEDIRFDKSDKSFNDTWIMFTFSDDLAIDETKYYNMDEL